MNNNRPYQPMPTNELLKELKFIIKCHQERNKINQRRLIHAIEIINELNLRLL